MRRRQPRRTFAIVLGLLIVVLIVVLSGTHEGVAATLLAGRGSGDTFQPETPPAGIVLKSRAIEAAIHFAFGASASSVRAAVHTQGFFGLYTDTIYRARPVWIIRFWGPGISISGSGGPIPLPGTPYCAPPIAHEELVVVDGRTGKYLEATVGFYPTGLPTVVVTPAPSPTPCPTRPPHPMTPWTIAVGGRDNVFLGGQGISGYSIGSEVQKRSTAGSLLFSFPTGRPHFKGHQIIRIALGTRGDIYVANDDNVIQKFGPNGHLRWQWLPRGKKLPQVDGWWNVAVAPNGTAYVASMYRGPIYVLSPNGQSQRTVPGRWSTLAVDKRGILYAANIGRGLIRSFSSAGTPLHSWHMGHHPGQAIIDAIRSGPDGSLYVLDERVKVPKPFYEVVRYSPEGRALRRVRIRQGPGAGEIVEPKDLAIGPQGTIYVADSGNPRIVILSARGQYLGSWAL